MNDWPNDERPPWIQRAANKFSPEAGDQLVLWGAVFGAVLVLWLAVTGNL